ncbi:aldose 1-epimerase [Erythrobacter sp. EC-HK427]|uniref:aldose 1-epimerase n=1 Tax=Erythrobacter sp. EC-HK427 TaxID=2038396 RepID=UPI00125B5DF0|nr:aldose 1-epimerase [Erythrobacter sp. EC-HK427]VVT01223.1 conserved hypothetical protein [Erythrobacter sp. EC-HK427]
MSVLLHADGWELELLPEIGGAIGALRRGDVEILRTVPAGSTNPLDAGCFPLVPYCNRIADARFVWDGIAVDLPHNFLPETSSLHGLGWQMPWSVTEQADARCTLMHEHMTTTPAPSGAGASGWPWAYSARQTFRLGARGLKMWLDVTNLSPLPMPAGLGLHPYFRRRPETQVRFVSHGMVDVDDRLIPTGEIMPAARFADWRGGASPPDQLVDHCFTGWDGAVEITDDLGAITLQASGAPLLHVYSPADGSALCCEPVSHLPDALNQSPRGMIALPPGCTASLEMQISAS